MRGKRPETTLAGVEKAEVRISSSGNPFRPGAGGKPPYFAGREDDWRVFDACLSCLQDDSVPLGPMVLFGPRGNGKTALMHRMAEKARGLGIRARYIDPHDVDSPEQLQMTLANAVEAGAGVDGRKVETCTLPNRVRRQGVRAAGRSGKENGQATGRSVRAGPVRVTFFGGNISADRRIRTFMGALAAAQQFDCRACKAAPSSGEVARPALTGHDSQPGIAGTKRRLAEKSPSFCRRLHG